MKTLMENWKKYIAEDTTILPTNKVGKVLYDPNGIGGTPNGREVDYFGYTVWITPQDFLKLNPKRGDESEFLAQHFQQEGDVSVAPCWIAAVFNETETALSSEPTAGTWHVDGHEGRGRAIEISKLQPDELMPVHIFPRGGKRAKDLTKEMVLSPIQSEVSSYIVRPTVVVWQGEVVRK